jgi:hypothetical protein
MRSPRLILCFAAALAACETPVEPDARHATPPPLASRLLDGAHGGNPNFFFLPPVVAGPRHTGTADMAIAPTVTICLLIGADCGPVLATYDFRVGDPSAGRDAAGGFFFVNWNTRLFTLDPAQLYRVAVSVLERPLGYVDVQVVSNGSAKNAGTGDVVTLVDGRTLPIRFRIERGAVGLVSASAASTFELSSGAVHLSFPAEAVAEDIAVTATPVAPGAMVDRSVLGGSLFEFQPSPITFARPVSLTLSYANAAAPVRASRLAVCRMSEGACRPIAGSLVDQAHRTVTAEITGFSEYGLTEWPEYMVEARGRYPSEGDHEWVLKRAAGDVVVTRHTLWDAEWSPDGNRMLLVTGIRRPDCSYTICSDLRVVNWDGTGEIMLAPITPDNVMLGGAVWAAHWSPPGDRIAFSSAGEPSGDGSLPGGPTNYPGWFTLNVTASTANTVQEIADDMADDAAFAWSPDGARIVYTAHCASGVQCLKVVNADGSGAQVILTGARVRRRFYDIGAPNLAWSADGTKIAFVGEAAVGLDYPRSGLFVVNATGSGLRAIAIEAENNDGDVNILGPPHWAPDSDLLMWDMRYRESPYEDTGIHIARSDGSNHRVICPREESGECMWAAPPHPKWLGNGRIAFVWGYYDHHLYIANSDGTGLQAVAPREPRLGHIGLYWRP